MIIRTTKKFKDEIEKLGGKVIRDSVLTEVYVDGIEGSMHLHGDGKYHIRVTKRSPDRKEMYSEKDSIWEGYEKLVEFIKKLK